MISKPKALIYSLGAPLLYSLVQTVIGFISLVYFTVKALGDKVVIPTEQDEMLELFETLSEGVITATLPIMLISGVSFMVIMFVAHMKKPINLWTAVGLTRTVSVRTLIMAALAGMAFNIACVGLIEAMPVPPDWQAANEAVGDALVGENNILFSIFLVSLLIPLVEEVVFRGFTQRILHHAFTPWAAIIIQGFIFGIFHANALQTIYTFATGIIIGYIYMKSQNLWTSVVFHMAYNGTTFILHYISRLFSSGEAESGMWILAVMAAGGATLTLMFVRSIKNKEAQKEIE